MTTNNLVIFDFNNESDLGSWIVVNDSVMGGYSHSKVVINQEGHAQFKGHVSLKNNGGFSSVRYRFPTLNASSFTHAEIRLKGDGKRYQFRVRSSPRERQFYMKEFETSGEWQTLEIELSQLVPIFRGRRLNMPNYDASNMTEVSFLIANKKDESFELEIDHILLVKK